MCEMFLFCFCVLFYFATESNPKWYIFGFSTTFMLRTCKFHDKFDAAVLNMKMWSIELVGITRILFYHS